MPYYTWEGIDQTGSIQRGVGFAQSIQRLDTQLFSRRIALLKAKITRSWVIFCGSITRQRADFYKNIYRLLDAGIMLPDALHMVADLADKPRSKAVLLHIGSLVQAGEPMHKAISHAPFQASSFDLQLIKAGEQSGQLKQALAGLTRYYEVRDQLKQKLRQVLFVPVLSLGFFLGLFLIILFVVVPQFVSFFQSLGQPVPTTTLYLLYFNSLLKSWAFIGVLALFGFVRLIGKRMVINFRIQTLIDTYMLQLPVWGTIVQERFLISWCYSLGLLCERGIPLSQALSIITPAMSNRFLAGQVQLIDQLVKSGRSLSQALMSCDGALFPQSLISMITVAEASGTMPAVMHYIARAYSDTLYTRLDRLAAIAQPALLMVLGLGVALLILAIYGPILSISQSL